MPKGKSGWSIRVCRRGNRVHRHAQPRKGRLYSAHLFLNQPPCGSSTSAVKLEDGHFTFADALEPFYPASKNKMRFDDDGVAVAADGAPQSQVSDASLYAGDGEGKLSMGGSTQGADKAGDAADWLGLSDGDMSEGEQTFAIKEVCGLTFCYQGHMWLNLCYQGGLWFNLCYQGSVVYIVLFSCLHLAFLVSRQSLALNPCRVGVSC